MRNLTRLVLLAVCGWRAGLPVVIAQQKKDAGAAEPTSQKPLDRDSYRLKVEPILEPSNDVGIYRIRIWTSEKRELHIHTDNGAIALSGRSIREKDGKLYRGDFVLFVAITKEKDKAELEFRLIAGGDGPRRIQRGSVDASTQLPQVLEIRLSDRVHKLGHKEVIGRFRGGLLEVEASAFED